MAPLTEKERCVLGFIFSFSEEWKNSPNVAEISENCGGSLSSIRYTLYRLDAKGYIQWVYVRGRKLIVPLYKM